MKKHIYIAIIVVAVIAFVGFIISHIHRVIVDKDFIVAGDYVYHFENGELCVVGYCGNEVEIEIPAKYMIWKVRRVGCALAKYQSDNSRLNTDIVKIVIPEGVETVESIFNGYPALKEIYLPDSLKTISEAFEDCEQLDTVIGGNNLSYISGFYRSRWYEENDDRYFVFGDGVLIKCTVDTKDIVIPDNVKIIMGHLDLSGIETVTIPESVIAIKDNAFREETLKEVNGAEGVIEVGRHVFHATKWLTEYVGDYVIVGKALVKYKGSATEIMIPEGVESVSRTAFNVSDNLANTQVVVTEVVLPSTMRSFTWRQFDYGNDKPIRIVITSDTTEIDVDSDAAVIVSNGASVSRRYAREQGLSYQDID